MRWRRLAGALFAAAALQATAGEPAAPAQEPAFGAAAETAQLETLRGGARTVNDMSLAGTTASNSATNVATGSNSITEGAFNHMSGIPVVVQNTGANVLIQNALILNLQMQ